MNTDKPAPEGATQICRKALLACESSKPGASDSPEEVLALDLFIKLSRASDAVAGKIAKHLLGSGISPSQFGILDALYHTGPLSLGELAKKHLRSPNNITSVADTMERSGLVVRERQKHDRRLILVNLTDKGRETFESLWEEHARVVTETMSPLSANDQKVLADLLRTLGTSAS